MHRPELHELDLLFVHQVVANQLHFHVLANRPGDTQRHLRIGLNGRLRQGANPPPVDVEFEPPRQIRERPKRLVAATVLTFNSD